MSFRLHRCCGKREGIPVLPHQWGGCCYSNWPCSVGRQSLCKRSFGGIFVLSRCFWGFSVGVGAFVIGLSLSFLFLFSFLLSLDEKDETVKRSFILPIWKVLGVQFCIMASISFLFYHVYVPELCVHVYEPQRFCGVYNLHFSSFFAHCICGTFCHTTEPDPAPLHVIVKFW